MRKSYTWRETLDLLGYSLNQTPVGPREGFKTLEPTKDFKKFVFIFLVYNNSISLQMFEPLLKSNQYILCILACKHTYPSL